MPERLNYEISWAGVGVGTASIETSRTDAGLAIFARGATKKWVSFLYPVDDEISCTIQRMPLSAKGKVPQDRPLGYRVLLREDKRRVDHEIRFDHKQKKASFHDRVSGRTVVQPLDAQTTDLLSAMHRVRTMPLEVGRQYSLPIFDNGSAHAISVQVLRTETIDTSIGRVETLVVRLRYVINALGLMYLPGDVYVWITDDDRRAPVVLEKQIIIPPGSRIPAALRPKLEAAMGSVRMVLVKP